MSNIKKSFLIIIIFFSVYCAITLGIEWDARTHLQMGKNRLNYFFSFGKINDELWFAKFFPGISYTLTAFIVQLLPKKIEFEVLHLSNLFFSLSFVLVTYKLFKDLFVKKIAQIVFVLLILFPAFFGQMSTNPKDTVIAFSFMWIFFLCLQYLKKQNNPSKRKKIILKIAFLLALGSGVRIVFPTVLIPLLIFLIIEIFYFKKIISKNFNLKFFLVDLLKILFFSYLILVLFWPQVHGNIFTEPFAILGEMFDSPPVGAPSVLLNGVVYSVLETPKYYLLLNLLLKTPEYILVLTIFSIPLLFKYIKYLNKVSKNFNYNLFLIVFILFVSNVLFYYAPIGFYDGLRLFLYIIPIFLVFPSICLFLIFEKINLTKFKIFFSLVSVMFIFFLFNFISLTPYHYTYLNSLNGKKSLHSNLFENDYKGLSLKELIKQSSFLNKKFTKLAVCGAESGNVKHYLKKFGYSKVRVVRIDEDYDFVIMTNRLHWTDSNIKKTETCFKKYENKGKIFSKVEKQGLILSIIKG